MSHPYLSIIIPAYNEANRIGRTLDSLSAYLRHVPYEYEVIVVSDGSTDQTANIVQSYAAENPRFVLIKNPKNQGKGYAVKCGMLSARGDYRLFMDADNSVDISQVPPFLEAAAAGSGVVIGSIALGRSAVEHNGRYRRILGSIAKSLIHAVAAPGVQDTQRGFKLFTRDAAMLIFPKQPVNGFGFDIELLVIAQVNGLRITELPVEWDNPAGSKVSWKSYVATLGDLVTVLVNRSSGLYQTTTAAMSR